jgi:threonine synthase
MNENDAFGDFIRGEPFVPKPLKVTRSPALDVSNPANYERLASFYDESPAVMRNMVFPDAISDAATMDAMEAAWKRYGVLLDPHGAVAFAAAEQLISGSPGKSSGGKGRDRHSGFDGGALDTLNHVVILSTGHPAKESAVVREATGQDITVPSRLLMLREKSEPIALINPQLDALEGAIASCF